MNKQWMIGALLFTGAFSAGCIMGSAKIWSQDQTGGVMALEGDENKAMEDANAKMSAHCGFNNWHVVRRETVTVGQEQYASSATDYGEATDSVNGQNTTTNANQYGSNSNTQGGQSSVTQGGSQTNTVAGTRDVNEIRIHYRCGQSSMPQGAPPMQAPPMPQNPAPAPQPGQVPYPNPT